MQICRITQDKLRDALELVWEVFEKYGAPDYEEMGIATFRHFIEYHNMVEKVHQGEMRFWGCYLNNYLIGVVALRKFHHLGVARKLINVAIDAVDMENPRIRAVTVNSSPYAVGFYEKMGFVPLGPEQKADGIRFTSMRLSI